MLYRSLKLIEFLIENYVKHYKTQTDSEVTNA